MSGIDRLRSKAVQYAIEFSASNIAGLIMGTVQKIADQPAPALFMAWQIASRSVEIIESKILADPIAGPLFRQWKAEAEAEAKGRP